MLNLVEIRKELHKIPEPAFQENLTTEFICKVLSQFEGLKLHRFTFTGLVAEYSNGEGDYILFRSDLDGLPITEKNDCEFRSQHDGFMHACGHDIHITTLLGLIEYVVNKQVKINALFVFQPAEESQGGAEKMIQSKIFDRFQIREAYALHVNPALPFDTISSKAGVIFGIPQELDVVFQGKSAHVVNAHSGRDAIKAAIDFVSNIYKKTEKFSAEAHKVLINFGVIGGGSARNIIAEECRIEGTIRTYTRDDMTYMKKIIAESLDTISSSNGVGYELSYLSNYDPVVNSERLYHRLKQYLPKDVNFIEAEAALTGEDFGFFAKVCDILLFWVGAENDSDLHSSTFLPDAKTIDTGLKVYKSIVDNFHQKML